MKLISMTDFVLEQNIIKNYIADFEKVVLNYAKFLKQPLTLGMFVPCDDEGNVLKRPLPSDYDNYNLEYNDMIVDYEAFEEARLEYKKAKEKVLFEGFTCKIADWCDELIYELDFINYDPQENVFTNNVGDWLSSTTIEDLFIYANETADTIKLTESAIKQIGL